MANLNFPSTTGQPTDGSFQYTDANNGVIYSWDGIKWEANSGSSLNSMYVQVAGDNMTGNLTLGTDKITLKTDGSIKALGSGDFGGANYEGFAVRGICRQPGTPLGFGAITARNLTTGGYNFLGVTAAGGTETCTITEDGKATFAGDLLIGESASSATAGGVYAGNFGQLVVNNINDSPSTDRVLLGKHKNVTTSEINADGSATFAGNIESAGRVSAGDVYNGPWAICWPDGRFEQRSSSTTAYILTSPENGVGVEFNSNGSAQFAGDVKSKGNILTRTVVLELEADDDTKYTSTTDADGNETRVYNGATLDVKDRLTKTDAALQSLKAALVTTTDHASLKAALIAALADI